MADSIVWLAKADTSIVSLPYISETTRPEYLWYLSQVDRIIDTGLYPTHESCRHATFLSEISNRDVRPRIAKLSHFDSAQKKFPMEKYILLIPTSNEVGRQWPFESYCSVGQKFIDGGYTVVLAGGSHEVSFSPERANLVKAGAIDFIGKTSLRELLALISRATLVICNDSGPAHMSIALAVPTIVCVGGGHFGSFVPYPQNLTAANVKFLSKKMGCYHCFWKCHKRSDNTTAFPCIAAIDPSEVWKAAVSIIKNEKGERQYFE